MITLKLTKGLGMLSVGLLLAASPVESAAAAPDQAAIDAGYASQPEIDPRVVIRSKAMTRAKERANRMALRDFYGIRPERPRRVATPLVGVGHVGRTYGVVAPIRGGFLFR